MGEARPVERRPDVCPECEEVDSLTACGPGVERLAEEATALFPAARILVLSSDFPGGAERCLVAPGDDGLAPALVGDDRAVEAGANQVSRRANGR